MATLIIIGLLLVPIIGLVVLGVLLNDAYKEYMSDEDDRDLW